MRRLLAALLLALPLAGLAAGALVSGRYAGLPGGVFKSVLRYEDAKNGVRIKPFAPVSYTHLDVYKRQAKALPTFVQRASPTQTPGFGLSLIHI